MPYLKPELIATEAALEAIRGWKWFLFSPDADVAELLLTVAAYEIDE
jgi:hypothetical protein